MSAGVYVTTKKDKTEYYRVSVTFKNKHISLGSFNDKKLAQKVYREAKEVIANPKKYVCNTDLHSTGYNTHKLSIPFEKYIILLNFRDNNIYIKTPIYLCKKYFLYFLSEENVLTFNVDDLFYYSTHKIMSRGGYYFVNDFGMQTSILSRYGIRAHSVKGRDYIFRNGDEQDFRYENICVINSFHGVIKHQKNGLTCYRAYIHINGNYNLGTFNTEAEAAIAYNKAVDILKKKLPTSYETNYIEDMSPIEYAKTYNSLKLSKKFLHYADSL